MPIQIKTPNAPATARQLWLLHILTKEDTRNLDLTMAQASQRIAELKRPHADRSNDHRPLVNPHATAIQQDRQLIAQQRHDRQQLKTKSTPLFTIADAEQVLARRYDRQYHYYLMVKPKRKWLSYHRTTHIKTIKQELNNPYYSIKGWYIVKARAVWCARQMLDRGLSELIINGKLYAKLLEQGGKR